MTCTRCGKEIKDNQPYRDSKGGGVEHVHNGHCR